MTFHRFVRDENWFRLKDRAPEPDVFDEPKKTFAVFFPLRSAAEASQGVFRRRMLLIYPC